MILSNFRHPFCVAISFLFFNTILLAQVSPWGTGIVNNMNLGVLEDNTVVFPSNSGYGNNQNFFPNPDELLMDYTFDLYIPPTYDGSEPYGLVTWINSGNNGTVKSQWIEVLNEKKLIWVGGDNIGNSIYTHIRMGTAWAAVYRMRELLNIDEDRIYTSGNSGGARMANTLAYVYPEWIAAALPTCGSSYLMDVAQDYETQDPDSHYETILPFSADHLEYVKTFDQKYGIMTSYDDFREGDIMNIYHNGMEMDGLKGKFLETAGGHCSTTAEHFRDALNFVEHSFTPTIVDDFETMNPSVGLGYISENTAINNGNMIFSLIDAAPKLKTKDLFRWNDSKGAIFRTSIQPDANTQAPDNSIYHLGIWEYADQTQYCDFTGTPDNPEVAGIILSIEFLNAQPTLNIRMSNPNNSADTPIVFSGTLSDWSTSQEIKIKYHLWDQELRIELGNHIDPATTTTTNGVRLLDDRRSVRIRWNEMNSNGYWGESQWANGAFVTMFADRINQGTISGNLLVNYLEVITDKSADAIVFPTVVISELNGDILADAGFSTYEWYLDGNLVATETTNTLVSPAIPGLYTVIATDEYGCTAESNELNFFASSLEEDIFSKAINIHPNPSNGQIEISLDKTIQTGVDLRIYSVEGKLISEKYLNSDVELLNLNHLSKGIYFLELSNTEFTTYKKIVIE